MQSRGLSVNEQIPRKTDIYKSLAIQIVKHQIRHDAFDLGNSPFPR